MAGSGKTTLTQRLNSYVHEKKISSYFVNLDPAVATVPFEANIDIRDSLNYREVMEQYSVWSRGILIHLISSLDRMAPSSRPSIFSRQNLTK